jgi:hypothetical protein
MEDRLKAKEKVEAKRKKYEEQGFADVDFEKEIDGKKIKMFLPSSVFVQQKMIIMASKVFSNQDYSVDEESDLAERFIKAVCKHTQINGNEANPEQEGIIRCQAYALMYWLELLNPLSTWGESIQKKMIL